MATKFLAAAVTTVQCRMGGQTGTKCVGLERKKEATGREGKTPQAKLKHMCV
jgi:hypothetical protein